MLYAYTFGGKTARALAKTVMIMAAGALLLACILAYAPWDEHLLDDWPLAVFPAFPGYTFAHMLGSVTLTATDSIDNDEGSLTLDGASGIDVFEISGRTYAAVASYDDSGVQVLDLTDPSSITAAGHIADNSTLALGGATSIDVFEISGRTYAAVAADDDSGVQILDLTDPSNIDGVDQIDDSEDSNYELEGANDIDVFEISGRTYAAVAAFWDSGVQILNLTDPASVTAAGHIADNSTLALGGASGIDVFEVSGRTYAAVAASNDGGVQVLDLTDPSSITAAGHMTDNSTLALGGAYGIDVFEISGRTYAAVAASVDGGVQILNLTDPSNVTPVDQIDDSEDSSLVLEGAINVDVFERSGRIYAAVAADLDNGVQILNLTDPSNIDGIDQIDDSKDSNYELEGASGIDVFEVSGRTYAAVASYDDSGVQVLDLTDPASVTAAGQIDDGGSLELEGAINVDVFERSGRIYAAVAADLDNGVQVLDLTDPSNVTAAGHMTDNSTLALGGATSIDVFEISGRTYAAVAADDDSGVQILDLTDPSNIDGVDQIYDSEDSNYELEGANDIDVFEISGRTYAAVAAFWDRGVQVLDLTDPASVTAAGHIADNSTLALGGASGIDVFEVSGRTYAAVASYDDGGVQVLDLTDPASVTAAGHIADNSTLALGGASGIDVFEVSGRTYAAVASYDDGGVQVLNLTDPSNVTPVDQIDDSEDSSLVLEGAINVDVFERSGRIYAAVAADLDNGVQILDLTDPSNVTAASQIDDSKDSNYELEGASGIDVFEVSGRTYAAVASYADSGVQALHLNLPAANSPPAVYVGPDWFVDEQTAVTLAGTASDPDGDPLTYLWSCRAAPTAPTAPAIPTSTSLSFEFTAPDVSSDTAYTCTFTATDHHGVAASDRMTLTVRHVPDDRPVLGLIGEYNPTVVLGSSWVDPGATCVTLHDGTALPVTATGTVDVNAAGTYKITYSCSHNGYSTSHVRTVTVIPATDDQPPTINILNNRGAIASGLSNPDFGDDAVCTDREDGDISHTITVSVSYGSPDAKGNALATLTYSCTDSGGNTSADFRSVSVVDGNSPPEIHMRGDGLVWVGVGQTYTDPGAYCTDSEDGTFEATLIKNTVDTSTAGTYFVIYRCTDSDGTINAGGGSRTVYVVATNVPPSISVDTTDIVIPVNGTWAVPAATCTDPDGGQNNTPLDLTSQIEMYGVNSVDVTKPGTYHFTYFCTDAGGAQAQKSVRVIVEAG